MKLSPLTKLQSNPVELLVQDKIEVLQNYGIDLDKKIIFISGEIESILATALRIKFNMIKEYFLSKDEKLTSINLVMDSIGGDASTPIAILDFYDELKNEGIVVNMHVHGSCMSAATIICGGATGYRTASKRARFMVHEMQITNMGGTHTQTKAFQTELNRMQDDCYDLYVSFELRGKTVNAKETKKLKDKWIKACRAETYFSSEEAVIMGLIDEVL